MRTNTSKDHQDSRQSIARSVQRTASSSKSIQRKLTIGQPNDKYEQEADQVAERVIGRSAESVSAIPKTALNTGTPGPVQPMPGIQRTDQKKVQKGPFPHIMGVRQQIARLKPETGKDPVASNDVSNGIQRAKGGGSPLPINTRSQMESGIGSDFGEVRIHNDSTAHKLSAKLNAQAFTHGNDIFFNKGKYNPETQTGQHLLAHELTHTVQQTGKQAIQRQEEDDYEDAPENLDDVINYDLTELSKDIMQAQDRKDYETFAFLFRTELILGGRSYQSLSQYYTFYNTAYNLAGSEEETLGYLGPGSLRDYPQAFPVTWSDMFFTAMYLEGFDIEKLRAKAQKSGEELALLAEKIPPYLFEHGLPVTYKQLKKLRRFQLDFAHAQMVQNHLVKDYMRAGFDFVGHGWVYHFVSSWNQMVIDSAEAIQKGKITIDPKDYDEFIAKHKGRVESMADRFKSTWDSISLEEAQDDETSLKEASLAVMLLSGLGSLAGVMYQWQYAFDLFDSKKQLTLPMLTSLEPNDRAKKGIDWAYENGYFGEAGDHIMQGLKEHGWQIIGMVLLMIGALTASHVYPPLGIALDVMLLVWAGISVINALDNLRLAVKAFETISSVEDMQKKSGNLAQSLVADGLTVILELATMFVALKVGKGIRAAKAENPNMGIHEALAKSLDDGTEAGIVAQTHKAQGFLKASQHSNAAKNALAEAKGNLPLAKTIFTALRQQEKHIAAKIAEVHGARFEKVLGRVEKADLTSVEIRLLDKAMTKIQVTEALSPTQARFVAETLGKMKLQKLLIFSGVDNVDLIWGSARYWGMTEGAVYGARYPVNTFWQRLKAMVPEKEGMVIFQGQAAQLFGPHMFVGPYSAMKRALGQHKAGFGDIVFEQATLHGKNIIVTRARISRTHEGRWHHAPNFGSNDLWAAARLGGRGFLIEPICYLTLDALGPQIVTNIMIESIVDLFTD
ncbi:MAG: DUF4157 domain-containing protein [Roseivirga sp.]|nr:DUF4157 domain-containing protein [Roseivirga sp.]